VCLCSIDLRIMLSSCSEGELQKVSCNRRRVVEEGKLQQLE
jgi:hypothetical protein